MNLSMAVKSPDPVLIVRIRSVSICYSFLGVFKRAITIDGISDLFVYLLLRIKSVMNII